MVTVTGTRTTTIFLTTDDEIALIGGNGQLTVADAGIRSFGTVRHQIAVTGTITSWGPGIWLQNGDHHEINIGLNGSIDALTNPEYTTDAAIYTNSATEDTILNNGGITGQNGIVNAQGSLNLVNNGSIAAAEYAVSANGSIDATNAGSISAENAFSVGAASVIENSGSILAYNTAFNGVGAEGRFLVSNTGTISAHYLFNTEGDIYLDNSGKISSTLYTVITDGNLFFSNSGEISGYNGLALDGDDVNAEISNSGQIAFVNEFINNAGTTGQIIEISNSGDITVGRAITDVLFSDMQFELENSGSILASGGANTSGLMYIHNSGELELSNFDFSGFGAGELRVLNTGHIQMNTSPTGSSVYSFENTDGALNFRNDGIMQLDSIGVYDAGSNGLFSNTGVFNAGTGLVMQGSDNRIENSGVLSGNGIDVSTGYGIQLNGAGATTILNSGEINASGFGIRGTTLTDTIKIVNSGTIQSDSASAIVLINSGIPTFGHTIVNTGNILGDIKLGNGDDVYNGRSGFVSGTILGEDGDDIITGGEAADVIDGGSGANEIRSLGGDDVITTGDDADFIVAGFGDDEIISGNGDDTIRGGDGEDEINGQGGVDFIQGGNGNDYIRMGNGDGQRGEGNAGDDYIAGGNQKDVLLGGADEDELLGQGGNDVLRGGTGDDVLEGGTGDDRLVGNAGEDTAVFSGALADYTFTLNGNGTVDVEDTVGTDGTDNLFGVEYVEFTDGTYLLSDFV